MFHFAWEYHWGRSCQKIHQRGVCEKYLYKPADLQQKIRSKDVRFLQFSSQLQKVEPKWTLLQHESLQQQWIAGSSSCIIWQIDWHIEKKKKRGVQRWQHSIRRCIWERDVDDSELKNIQVDGGGFCFGQFGWKGDQGDWERWGVV